VVMSSSLTAPDLDAEVDQKQVRAIGRSLSTYARAHSPTPAQWDDPRYWNVESSEDDRRQFLAIGNAINFRFWEWIDGAVVPSTGVVDGEQLRGSMYMWRRLRLAVERGQLSLDAHDLAGLDEAAFIRAFNDELGNLPLRPGLEDRVANLRDLGSGLCHRWQGKFGNLVRGADGKLEQFASLSAGFRAFDDPVRKLTMVNAIMLAGSGLAVFDRDPLPGVDYHLIKQALRQGLVAPSTHLAHKLARQQFLNPDESQALRSAVLDALIGVAEAAGVSTAVLDNMYWANRRVCGDERWLCDSCPFNAACAKRTEYGLPLEVTRYY
jgi:Potential Queuosine, Q, salvage protein family